MTTQEGECPHGAVPRHACLDGSHQCRQCGAVSCHTVTCTANPERLTPQQRAELDAALDVAGQRQGRK